MKARTLPLVLTLMAIVFFPASWFGLFLSGSEVTRFTGLELVFGTRFSSTSPAAFVGAAQPQLGAQIAAAAVLSTLLLGLFPGRRTAIGAAGASILASAGLLATAATFPAAIREHVSGVIEIKRGQGYHLAVLCLLAAAVSWSLYAVRRPSNSGN